MAKVIARSWEKDRESQQQLVQSRSCDLFGKQHIDKPRNTPPEHYFIRDSHLHLIIFERYCRLLIQRLLFFIFFHPA
jgi:hypothetical protein